MNLVMAVLGKAKAAPSRIASVLQSMRSFEGLTGIIVLDEYGDAHRDLYLKRVDGNRIITLGKLE